MKNILFVLSILLTFAVLQAGFVPLQCQNCQGNSGWTRYLPAGQYTFTWSWDEQLNGAVIMHSDPYIAPSQSDQVSIVKSAIAAAFQE